MIATTDLTRRYGDKLALDRLTFRAEPGEILGFLGPNGAGKSTTVRMLTGMIKPTSGRAQVAGFDVVERPLEVKRRIGYVPESGALYETLTALEYLDLVAALHNLDPSVATGRAGDLLDLLGLLDERRQIMTTYSKGMRQKVLIAAALLHRPDVLLFDEPLNGLDANAALLIKELLRGLAAQGKTILFCSHILEVVERMCTRILVIDKGQKLAEGTPGELLQQTGTGSLDLAFARLTGGETAPDRSASFLSSLREPS